MAHIQELQSEKELTFTCEICIEPNNITNRFRNSNNCSHPFCTDCVVAYIRSKLEYDNTGNIKCPEPGCVKVLDPFDCARFIERPMFIRWTDVLCEAAIIGQDKCYCPRISCNEVILNECGGEPKKIQCPKCRSWFCFQCKIGWHYGFRCDESLQLRDDNDVAFGRLAESNKWMRCPQCSHYCEKVDGCNTVKCRCGTRFCYMCGRRTLGHICDDCDSCCNCCGNCLGIFCVISVLALMAGFLWWICSA